MYEDLIRRLREEKPTRRLAEQAAGAIEELSVIVRAQKAVIDKLTQQLRVETENGKV